MTSTPLLSFTLATFRKAEFGLRGVVVYTRTHTPRRCGLPLRAAVVARRTFGFRPFRTSCWMVGTIVLFFGVRSSDTAAALVSSAVINGAATGLVVSHLPWDGPLSRTFAHLRVTDPIAYRRKMKATPTLHGIERCESGCDRDNTNQRVPFRWSTRCGQTERLLRAPSSPELNSGASNDRHHRLHACTPDTGGLIRPVAVGDRLVDTV